MNSVRQSLYLKYRPRRFGDLVGQEVVARTLRNAVRERRFSHAYLFTGIRGTGKTSAARILAKAINCEAPDDGEPCGRCRACESIGEGRSLDVIEIDAATNRGIDEIRDLRERAQFLPSELPMKVYIIDEAHMLTNEAGNAFLKTLEEPPKHACFILATTEPHKLTETVLSRCQRFDFRRIPVASMADHLAHICSLEGITATPEVMELVAQAGAGSLRDAESLLDRLLGTGDRALDLAAVRSALGMADPGAIARLADSLAGSDLAAALGELQELSGSGVEPRQLLRTLGETARERHWAELTNDGSTGFWLDLMAACAGGGSELRRADDPWMVLEVILIKAALGMGKPAARSAGQEAVATASGPKPQDPQDKVPNPIAESPLPQREPSGPAPKVAIPPPVEPSNGAKAIDGHAPSPSVPEATAEWQQRWAAVIQWAQQHHPGPFAALVRETRAAALDNGTLTVEVRYPWHLSQLRTPANLAILAGACQELFSPPVQVQLVLLGEAEPKPASREVEPKPAPREVEPSALALALKHFPGSTVRKVEFHEPSGPPSIGP